jgi:rare lipoprotein A
MSRLLITSFISLLSLTFSASAQPKTGKRTSKITRQKRTDENGKSISLYYGVASYYADKFQGRKTATGDVYSPQLFTAACNVLPLRSWIRVTNMRNNKSIVLYVNDRLHATNNRLVDLSKSAADSLGYIKKGLARVKVEVLGKRKPKS